MIAAGNLQTKVIDISVLVGMIVLSCIPTTIASNVVFTRNAGKRNHYLAQHRTLRTIQRARLADPCAQEARTLLL